MTWTCVLVAHIAGHKWYHYFTCNSHLCHHTWYQITFSTPLRLSYSAYTLAIHHSGHLWDLNYWSNTPNGIIPCQHVADPGIGLPPGPDLPYASLLPSSLCPSGQRGLWQSPNPSTPVREGCTATTPSWASISLIHWAGVPWEWSGHMASPRFCLLVPSESTHPRRTKRGAH